ncbi:major capsid protein [Microviridae sp.]|nr:major capsid protein [Microviridae sp.]
MKRNIHSLSSDRLLTGDMGELLPIGVSETLPGDVFQHSTAALIRLSPQLAPVMHRVKVRIHHFFVPNRIIDPNWEDIITGGPDNENTNVPTITIPADPLNTAPLLDRLGIPLDQGDVVGMEICAYPVWAFNTVYNEYYRDQDLVQPRALDDLTIPKIAWEKDYFTAARPWPQKGDAITIPITGRIPVKGIAKTGNVAPNIPTSGRDVDGDVTYDYAAQSNGNPYLMLDVDPATDNPDIYADGSLAEQVPINEFRKAFALQRYAEARAQYGSRYTEYLRYLGVRSSDARINRPEFLGGGVQQIAFSEVLQTAPDDSGGETTYVGDLHGHGIAAMRSNKYRRFFEEHGHVISLLSVRPKAQYSTAIHRKWLRTDKESYFQKELEYIGQQEIPSRELYAEAGANGDAVLGYQNRYKEYTEEPSIVCGEFRNTQKHWHLSREFDSAPVLNEDLITCNPSKRIYAAQENHGLWIQIHHNLKARRMVSANPRARIL